MTQKKYNLIPLHQANTQKIDSPYLVTIHRTGSLYFSKFDVAMYALDKKILKFFIDVPNKTIAWKVFEEGSIGDLKHCRKLTYTKSNGSCTVSIKKILKIFGISDTQLPLKNIPVEQYTDGLLGDKFELIDLKKYLTK